eukprot:681553-Prymnesium_polylepis.1
MSQQSPRALHWMLSCMCGDPATLACVLCSTILEAPLEPQLGCISVVTKRLRNGYETVTKRKNFPPAAGWKADLKFV